MRKLWFTGEGRDAVTKRVDAMPGIDRTEAYVRRISASEAIGFMGSHSPLANADLLRYATSDAERIELLGAFVESELAAVAGILSTSNPVYDHLIWAECSTTPLFRGLLAGAPAGRLYVKVHHDSIADWLETGLGLQPERRDVYFTVTAGRLTSQPLGDTRVLSREDAQCFADAAAPAAATLTAEHAERTVWGIERHGRIVCSGVCSAVAQAPAVTIGAIADVYTNKAWRCCGMASRLVCAMTSALLAENDHVLYWTTPDNVASQRPAARLGYEQTHLVTEFLVDNSGGDCRFST